MSHSDTTDRRIPVLIAGLDGISGVSAWSFRLRDALQSHSRYRIILANCRVTGNHVGRFDCDLPSRVAAREYLRELAPAIVVPNFVWPLFDVCAELIAEGVALRCAGYCRADSAEEYYTPLGWYEPLIAGFAAVSPECHRHLTTLLPHRAGDIATIPTGVVVPPYVRGERSSSTLRLVYGGRVVQEQKRVMDFVPLVEALLARSCDFTFDVAGQGRQLGELKSAMARVGHGGRVRFLGKVAVTEMDAVWDAHDVFIQVSAFEGTSNSMLESMARGCVPAVTRTGSGIEGIVEDGVNGVLVSVGDMEGLADRLCRLAGDGPRLETMGRAARETATRYSIDVCAGKFVALLDAIMDAPVRSWPATRMNEQPPEFAGLALPEIVPEPAPITTRLRARVADISGRKKHALPEAFGSPDTVVLVAAADDNFVMPLAAMVRSAFCNLSGDRRLLLYVLDGGIASENRERLLESWVDARLHVRWLRPALTDLADMKITGHVNILTYCRLLIPRMLPERHEKAIYLDSDVIVLGDLAELWDVDLDDCHVLAVQDMTAPFMCSRTALPNFEACAPYLSAATALANYRELGIPPDARYFNAGVMVMNVARWRDTRASESILKYLRDHRDQVRWWDQDGLNAVLYDSWRPLDRRWNQIPHIFRYPSWRESPFGEADYAAITERPKAIHYSARSKPWHGDDTHPFRDAFFQYLDLTAWRGWRPQEPVELVANGTLETGEADGPAHWRPLAGTVLEPLLGNRAGWRSTTIRPAGTGEAAGLEQALDVSRARAGARFSLCMTCCSSGRRALELRATVTSGGKAVQHRAFHRGDGVWATLRHEIDLPVATESLLVRIALHSGAGPAAIRQVRGVLYLPDERETRLEWDAPDPVDLRRMARRRAWKRYSPAAWVRTAARVRRRRRALRAPDHADRGLNDRTPMFSVILSNYNGAEFLEEALRSAALQEGAPFELIVVDDGSTDGSRAIIERIAAEFPDTVRPLFKGGNEGQGAGFNDGFDMACGDIVCFLDSDDVWFPGKLARLAALVQAEPDCAVYQHNLFKMFGSEVSGEKFRDLVFTGDLLAFTLRTRAFPHFVPTSGLAFSRRALERVMPIPRGFRVCADGYLTRTALCFGPVASSNDCWGAYRVHDGNNVFENPEHDASGYVNGLLIPALNAFYEANGLDLRFEAKPVRGTSRGLAPRVKATKRPLITRVLDSSLRELIGEARRRLPL